jgi:5-methylcytosine-specific restriction endonuclease McrA
MSRTRPKPPHLRLDPIAYESLRQQVLQRDGWRCQACGVMSNLDVHHIEFRSQGGDDSELNLITLCTACHTHAHRRDSTSTSVGGRKGLQRQSQEPGC